MKIYRFNYSPYCLKVEKALDLMGLRYEKLVVPYLNRAELVRITDGYIQVPVLVEDSGKVIKDSRTICEYLVKRPDGEKLIPRGAEALSWAYHDWCDNQLEDTLFKLASPFVFKTFKSMEERSFYSFIKERKYGAGCIGTWHTNYFTLLSLARQQLTATENTLSKQDFIQGSSPTLPDVALYGQFAMVHEAGINIEAEFGPTFSRWFGKLAK